MVQDRPKGFSVHLNIKCCQRWALGTVQNCCNSVKKVSVYRIYLNIPRPTATVQKNLLLKRLVDICPISPAHHYPTRGEGSCPARMEPILGDFWGGRPRARARYAFASFFLACYARPFLGGCDATTGRQLMLAGVNRFCNICNN